MVRLTCALTEVYSTIQFRQIRLQRATVHAEITRSVKMLPYEPYRKCPYGHYTKYGTVSSVQIYKLHWRKLRSIPWLIVADSCLNGADVVERESPKEMLQGFPVWPRFSVTKSRSAKRPERKINTNAGHVCFHQGTFDWCLNFIWDIYSIFNFNPFSDNSAVLSSSDSPNSKSFSVPL